MIGFLKLVRFQNLVILGLTQYFTAVFLATQNLSFWDVIFDLKLFILVFSTSLVAGAGYIINDYYDVKIDALNKPKQLVIDRLVRRREALLLHFLMNFTGVLFSFLVGIKIGLITFVVSFLLWLYSNDLKRRALIGNLLIALLTALSLIIISVYFESGYLLVFYYSVFSFFISVAREIIKDMEDVQGDALHGCKTLPILYGVLFAKKVVYVVLALLLLAMVVISISMNSLPMFITTFVILLLVSFVIYRLYFADKKSDYRLLGNMCKLVMLFGVFSMVFA